MFHPKLVQTALNKIFKVTEVTYVRRQILMIQLKKCGLCKNGNTFCHKSILNWLLKSPKFKNDITVPMYDTLSLPVKVTLCKTLTFKQATCEHIRMREDSGNKTQPGKHENKILHMHNNYFQTILTLLSLTRSFLSRKTDYFRTKKNKRKNISTQQQQARKLSDS